MLNQTHRHFQATLVTTRHAARMIIFLIYEPHLFQYTLCLFVNFTFGT